MSDGQEPPLGERIEAIVGDFINGDCMWGEMRDRIIDAARAVSRPPVQPDRPDQHYPATDGPVDSVLCVCGRYQYDGWTFPEQGLPPDFWQHTLTLAAPPVQPVPSGLDADRLAFAMRHVIHRRPTAGGRHQGVYPGLDAEAVAAEYDRLAAEYARLTHPVEGSTESGEER